MSKASERLRALIQGDFVGNLFARRKETFFGPTADLQSACLENTPFAAEAVRQVLERAGALATSDLLRIGIDPTILGIMQHIASIYIGVSPPDVQALTQLLNDSSPHVDLPAALPEDIVWYSDAQARLRYSKDAKMWTAADWQILAFAKDALLDQTQRADIAIERTPIFVADQHVGRVLWLAADRLPGPAMVTPHWWRLGLVPLGQNRQLMIAIQQAMQSVMDGHGTHRHHIRWWIEQHSAGGGWFEEIGEADSAQVAAACVAHALCDLKAPHPLLDPAAGVSATLDYGATDLDARPIGPVTAIRQKTQAAKRAGINTFVLESNCAEQTKSEWSDYTNDPEQPLEVQQVNTFGEAYEALLAMSSNLQQAKITCWQAWGTFVAEETATDSESRGSRHEAKTEQRYIDASKKQ